MVEVFYKFVHTAYNDLKVVLRGPIFLAPGFPNIHHSNVLLKQSILTYLHWNHLYWKNFQSRKLLVFIHNTQYNYIPIHGLGLFKDVFCQIPKTKHRILANRGEPITRHIRITATTTLGCGGIVTTAADKIITGALSSAAGPFFIRSGKIKTIRKLPVTNIVRIKCL